MIYFVNASCFVGHVHVARMQYCGLVHPDPLELG
jgi:hypothetical protein